MMKVSILFADGGRAVFPYAIAVKYRKGVLEVTLSGQYINKVTLHDIEEFTVYPQYETD